MSDQDDIIEETEDAEAEEASSAVQPKDKIKKAPSILTTKKRVKEILKKAKRPSAVLRQARVLKKLAKNVRNPDGSKKTKEQIMKEEGYSDSYSKNGSLKKTDAWNVLMETFLSDADLAKHHHQLLNASKIGTQIFSMGVKDEEIVDVIESFGFPVMKVLFVKGLGKVAYYSIPDHIAKKYALEMAYKLKQKYGDLTIVHKFGELSDEELEEELARVLSEGLGLAEGEEEKGERE